MGKAELIDIDLIRIDGGTQARVITNDDVVSDYAEHYRDETPGGPTLPPIDVFFDGTDYWLGDGFHRRHAAARAGLAKIDCLVHKGTKRDAILFAVGANHSHGLKRTNKDKRKAVEMLLTDAEWKKNDDKWVAEKAGVSHDLAWRMRNELSEKESSLAEPEKRKGRDGKTRPTKSARGTARKTKAKPEKPAPVAPAKDARGNELPDHLQKVAANSFLKDSIDALNRMIRAATDFGNSPAGRFLILHDDKSGKGVIPGLTQARNAMVNAQFHCICPECEGKANGCGECRKSGFLPAWRMAEIEAVS